MYISKTTLMNYKKLYSISGDQILLVRIYISSSEYLETIYFSSDLSTLTTEYIISSFPSFYESLLNYTRLGTALLSIPLLSRLPFEEFIMCNFWDFFDERTMVTCDYAYYKVNHGLFYSHCINQRDAKLFDELARIYFPSEKDAIAKKIAVPYQIEVAYF